jgi:hypothetical protein
MSDDVKRSWAALGEQMSALGALIQDRFAAPASETAASSAESPNEQIKEALDQVVAATKELGERVGDVARDDDVKASAKDAMASLDDALRTTVDFITEQIETVVSPSRHGDD